MDEPPAAGIEPGTRYTIPPQIENALERLFSDPKFDPPRIASIKVIYSPAFVRLHGIRSGSVTRPGRIHTNLSEELFFALDKHVLHEFYHVVQQWDRDKMSVVGYLLRSRRREREARDFSQAFLEEYRRLLGDPLPGAE